MTPSLIEKLAQPEYEQFLKKESYSNDDYDFFEQHHGAADQAPSPKGGLIRNKMLLSEAWDSI
jgi:hypothetical protein